MFAVDAASFLVSALFVYRTRPRVIEAAEREGTFREIVAGARYVARVPWLWVTIVLFGVVLMLQLAPQQVLMPKLVTTQWHRGVGSYALLTTLMGVGHGRRHAPLRAAAAAPPPRRRLLRRSGC